MADNANETDDQLEQEQAEAEAAALAAFEEGYRSVAPDESASAAPAPAPEPAPEAPAGGGDGGEASGADDQGAGGGEVGGDGGTPAPDPTQQQIEQITRAQRRVDSVLGNIQQQLAEIKDQPARGAGETSPAGAQGQLSDADIEKLVRETPDYKWLEENYPEIAKSQMAVAKAVAAQQQQGGGAVDLETLRGEVRGDFQTWRDEVKQELLTEMQYPGWEETIQTGLFGTWLESQPDHVRDLAASDSWGDARKLLSHYQLFEDWRSQQGAEVTDLRDEAQVRRYLDGTGTPTGDGGGESGDGKGVASGEKSGVGSAPTGQQTPPPSKDESRLRRSVPATKSGSGARKPTGPSPEEEFEAGFKSQFGG